MSATVLATIPPFEQIFFRKYDIAFRGIIVIIGLQVFTLRKSIHCYKIKYFYLMQPVPFVIPLQAIEDSVTRQFGVHLYVLRTDLNHPDISGNKLFKLKYNLKEATEKNFDTLLTFGGAFSNHIAATAAAGKEYGFKTIGIIRGDVLLPLNPTLEFARGCGMLLHHVSRTLYKDKAALYNYVNQFFLEENFCVIPEGGANTLGVKGCKEIPDHITRDFDIVCCACGTGTTLAGIIQALKDGQSAIGFQVLKAEGYIKNEVLKWLEQDIVDIFDSRMWNIVEDYHFGGYARIKPELLDFVDDFKKTHSVQLDYVYTGKMMFGIYDLMKKGFFKNGQRIVAIHTGGLQGNSGFVQE